MDYQDRLDQLNKNASERSVIDSIDRPIRGLIQEMNSRGIVTTFSCCGFNYDGEEEPKSHSDTGPFVVFNGPQSGDFRSYMAFHGFVADAYMCGWKVEMYYCNGPVALWTIRFELEPRQKTFYTQEDSLKAIHDYELPLMRIKMLEKALAARPGKLKEYVIRDGNANYDILDGEWQVKPKSDYVFKEVDATDL